jgi:hypothetical protein
MNIFFLVVELISYAFALFLFFKKKDLAIIYIPALIFSNNIIESSFSAAIYYGTVSILILSCIFRNGFFYKNNIFALLLFFYFLLLLLRASDLELIRSSVFSVLWLFLSIPLISAIYQKHSEEVIFKEITNCAVIVLLLFLINVLVCTVNNYSPQSMYGITKGVLYGNIYGAGFNILAVSIFIAVLKLMEGKRSFFILTILIISLACIMLSLRRAVMLLSVFGVAIALISFFAQSQARKFVVFTTVLFFMGYVIYSESDFKNEFNERYELRNLQEREVSEEKRFIEYELIYKDIFVYDAYSPWIGYEPLNSAGHYGKGVFELRTLHSDLPSIIHSSGIIGLVLYLLMVITAFRQSVRAATTNLDKFIVFFCFVTFVVYSITGRFSEAASMLLIYLLLMLPLAGKEVTYVETAETGYSDYPLVNS